MALDQSELGNISTNEIARFKDKGSREYKRRYTLNFQLKMSLKAFKGQRKKFEKLWCDKFWQVFPTFSMILNFREQTQANRLFFMEKYVSKNV